MTETTSSVGKVDIVEESKDIVTSIAKKFDDSFSALRIYGTREKPLFVAADIADMLNIGSKEYRKGESNMYEWGLHRLYADIQTKSGTRTGIVLTEAGVMLMVYASTTPLARKFQTFVLAVLKELFTKGVVTTASAASATEKLEAEYKQLSADFNRLKDENKALFRKLELEAEETERLFEENKKNKQLYDRSRMKMQDLVEEQYVKEENAKNGAGLFRDTLADTFRATQKKYCKPVFVYLVKPSKDISEIHDYDFEDEATGDDTYIFSISDRESSDEHKSKRKAATFYIHKGQKIDLVHKILKDRHLQLRKKDGGIVDGQYETTMQEIEAAIEEVYTAGLESELNTVSS